MINFNKIGLLVAVMFSTFFLISCNESTEQQSGDLTSASTETSSAETLKSGSIVSLSEKEVNVIDGEYFTVDIVMNDFVVTEGGAITLRFNSKVLQVSSVNVNRNNWSFINSNGQVDNVEGVISDIVFSSYQGVSGDAVIATVEFKAINKGLTHIALEESLANPFASNGQTMAVSFISSNVVSN